MLTDIYSVAPQLNLPRPLKNDFFRVDFGTSNGFGFVFRSDVNQHRADETDRQHQHGAVVKASLHDDLRLQRSVSSVLHAAQIRSS